MLGEALHDDLEKKTTIWALAGYWISNVDSTSRVVVTRLTVSRQLFKHGNSFDKTTLTGFTNSYRKYGIPPTFTYSYGS